MNTLFLGGGNWYPAIIGGKAVPVLDHCLTLMPFHISDGGCSIALQYTKRGALFQLYTRVIETWYNPS